MWLHIASQEGHNVRMWLPLFLVWLLLLPFVLLALALTILADVALFLVGQSYHHYTLLLLGCLGLLADTRGMTIRIFAKDSTVDVSIQ